jgi:hypothetical protein
MRHHRDGIGQVMSDAWFPTDVTIGIQAEEFNLGFVRPENLVSHGQSPLGAFWQTPSGLTCILLRSSFRLATLP